MGRRSGCCKHSGLGASCKWCCPSSTSIWFTYEHGPNVPQTLPFARTAGMVMVSAASKVGDTVSAMTFGGDQLLYQRLTTSAP